MANPVLAKSKTTPQNMKSVTGLEANVLTDIYREDVNIAIWQNTPTDSFTKTIKSLIAEQPNLKVVITATPKSVSQALKEELDSDSNIEEFVDHIALLVDMFCTLFELKRVGLRLTLLDKPMCPKFHVDKVPCRLVTTFIGDATQYLPNDIVDRTKLGAGSLGLTDEDSGIMTSPADIQQLNAGDIALLKGESWFNNEGAGIVHRSPSPTLYKQRLLLTLDFID